MNLYFIRHGEKDVYHGDVSSIKLTDKGHRQANLVGKRLENIGIDVIFTSTMTRAIQTAETINKYANVHIEIREELREIDMGECDKNGWEYVKSHDPQFIAEFERHEVDIPYPHGECGVDVWNRSSKILDEISQTSYENVVIVTHGGTIRSIVCGILEMPQAKRFSLGVPPEHCSITHVKHIDEHYFLHTFNDYSHLCDE